MKRIIPFLLFICLQITSIKLNSTEFALDPLELNHDWEIALHQVLLSNETKPFAGNETSVDSNEVTTNSILDSNAFAILNETSSVSSTSTSAPIKIVKSKIVVIEEEKDSDDYENEEEAESDSKTPEIVSKSLDDEVSEKEDEESDGSSKGRADQVRQILQESLASNAFKQINVTQNSSETEIWSSWAKMINIVSQESSVFMRSVLTPVVIETFYEVPELSSNCSSALMTFGTALQASELWALQMIDANGRLPIGVLSGTTASFGDYDQCLSVNMLDQEQEYIMTQGKYCLLEFSYPVPNLKPDQRLRYNVDSLQLLKSILANETDWKMSADGEANLQKFVYSQYSAKLYNGICIPNACSGEDIEVLLKACNFLQMSVTNCIVKNQPNPSEIKHLNRWKLMSKYLVDFVRRLDQFQLVSLITLSVCISLVALATLLDLIIFNTILDNRKPSFIYIFTRAFSVQCNWNKLFTINTLRKYTSANPDLRFINGMRVLTMLWIVFIHVAILGTLAAYMLVYRFEEEARPFGRSLEMQFIYNGFASVEIFFFISGFVLVFLTLRSRDNHNALLRVPSMSLYIGIRALRLLIPMIGMLSLQFLWPFLGSGPMFGKFTTELLDTCRANYWKNLLLISNYDKTSEVCLVHTWFLSADFQLHLLAYPLIVALSINESFGLLFNVALILAGGIIPSILHYQQHTTATLSALLEVVSDHYFDDMKHLYYPAYIHLSSYFTGFLLAYLLLKYIRKHYNETDQKVKALPSFKLLKPSVLSLSSVTIAVFAIAMAAIFSAFAWCREEGALISDDKLGSIYFGFHRIFFILLPVWIVWLCIRYPKNIISQVLSTNLMQILSRLSFSIYLVHILVVWYFLLSTRSFVRINLPDLLFTTGGVLLYSLPLALAFHFIFEAPWSNLLKHFQSQLKPKISKLAEETETSNTDSYELYIGDRCQCAADEEQKADNCQPIISVDNNGNFVTRLSIQ